MESQRRYIEVGVRDGCALIVFFLCAFAFSKTIESAIRDNAAATRELAAAVTAKECPQEKAP